MLDWVAWCEANAEDPMEPAVVEIEKEAHSKQFIPPADQPYPDLANALWSGCLRERHIQKSVPVRLAKFFLWAVCVRGKNKPGFTWALGVENPELLVARSMRRVQPTTLGMRQAGQEETVAVGDWQGLQARSPNHDNGTAPMPVLYDDSEVETAAYGKLLQTRALATITALAGQEGQQATWAKYRTCVREIDIEAVRNVWAPRLRVTRSWPSCHST
jgi:hypothetical protein